MNYEYELVPNRKEKLKKPIDEIRPCYGSLYTITHIIISFFAIYLTWRCNKNKFSPVAFILALLCPHFYIVYVLAVYGGCGIFDDSNNKIISRYDLFNI
jgi:hypothetical protein